jgi:hypothetical protein
MTRNRSQRGVAFAGLLVFIGVLVAASVATARLRNAAATGERVERVRDELLQQASTIRGKLLACVVQWPGGNNGTGHRIPYPAATVSAPVDGLECPGAPTALQPLWHGTDGVLVPRPMPDFGAWSYTNDATSMRLSIDAANAFTYTSAAMRSAALRLGTVATISGSTLTIVLSN